MSKEQRVTKKFTGRHHHSHNIKCIKLNGDGVIVTDNESRAAILLPDGEVLVRPTKEVDYPCLKELAEMLGGKVVHIKGQVIFKPYTDDFPPPETKSHE